MAVVHSWTKEAGDRAFSVTAPQLWRSTKRPTFIFWVLTVDTPFLFILFHGVFNHGSDCFHFNLDIFSVLSLFNLYVSVVLV